MRICIIYIFLISWFVLPLLGKSATYYTDSLAFLKPGVLSKMQHKYDRLTKRLSKQHKKMLQRMKQTEKKLAKKNGDTSLHIEAEYALWEKKFNTVSMNKTVGQQYFGRLDSLKTTLSFLQQTNKDFGTGVVGQSVAIEGLNNSLTSLEQQLQLSDQLQVFVKSRRDFWKQQLSKVGLIKDISRLNQDVYYYSQQLASYKTLINQPDKLLEMTYQYLLKQQSFRDFIATNSQLARLFRIPSGTPDPRVLAGLQTRSMVQSLVANQVPTGTDPQQVLQQQLSLAQAELNKLKNKINEIGGGSNEFEMPGFKPNQQKTKPFWERFELGLDIQSQRPNRILPVTSDIAFSLGYKLNDKSTIGVGVAYKLGWGKNFSNIKFSNEGVSLRSFADIKVKGHFWLTGGFEYNYQQSFTRIRELQQISAWQKSGLVGITKKYKIGKKEGKLQLLWDFMSYTQMPRTQPLKFRIGYQF